jgi:hemerythrin superfamily protein
VTRPLWHAIEADHEQVWNLINQITGGSGPSPLDPDEQLRVARELVATASSHEAAEESVVWPVIREVCPEGKDLVLQATSQERQAKRILNELDHIKAGNQEFAKCVRSLAGHTREHITYERTQIGPRLFRYLDETTEAGLVDRWNAARLSGPTRPHPHTPPVPAVLAVMVPLLSRMDRVRDSLRR